MQTLSGHGHWASWRLFVMMDLKVHVPPLFIGESSSAVDESWEHFLAKWIEPDHASARGAFGRHGC